ncbi:MAG: decarboxylating NADP(+)-dependent phosphogluconate dehydrogenase [Gammaproteobacteria bacterium]|nr:decarboxylating NADP(+)-dependent phosphogluconate dehydrogenase [Gammaproteobacteria bacterium]
MGKADIAVIGLAVMGENLVLNLAGKGFTVAVHNRTPQRTEAFIEGRARGQSIIGCQTLAELVTALSVPRKVLLMVKAGPPVDALIEQLLPLLAAGDIIMDGGNSYYGDTMRRAAEVESRGLRYLGVGISGGEEGALHGPSIMPGGSSSAWPEVRDLLRRAAARTEDGEPCCDWLGGDGAGHFVKMVHNGIEYGDMQLIGEAYQLMKQGLGLDNQVMHEVFADWNTGELDSYLIEITRDILAYRDGDGQAVVDLIEDCAGQKGTGRWTVSAALDCGQPLTLIGEAVFARCLSALKDERVDAADSLAGPGTTFDGDREQFIDDLRQTLYAAKIISYAQGFALLRAASQEYGWQLDFGDVALLWRAGCIIRSVFLARIKDAYQRRPQLANLMLDPFFAAALGDAQDAWRRVSCTAIRLGIALPAMTSALSYYDGYRCPRSPANLLQAQRDYFGAHTYERVDRPRGEYFHTDWTGRGGSTTAGSYGS